MTPLRNKTILAGATVAAALSFCVPAWAQSNDQQKQQGEAVVRQRTGPNVEVKPGQSARVVVLFPGSDSSNPSAGYGGQPQDQGRIQVVAVQGPPKQQGDQQQNARQQPESEIVFAKDKAVNGLVVFGGEEGASRAAGSDGSSITFMAEMGGKALQVDQASGGQSGRIYVMTCKLSSDQVKQMMEQQNPQQGQQNQQAQAAGGAEMTAEQKQAQQEKQQQEQQQRQQEMQKMQDQAHAVIFVYLDGEAKEQEKQQGQ